MQVEDVAQRKLLLSSRFVDRRDAGGSWLKHLREQAGLSHDELARRVGMRFPALVRGLEIGRGRIPRERYVYWAAALGVSLAEFSKLMDRHYRA